MYEWNTTIVCPFSYNTSFSIFYFLLFFILKLPNNLSTKIHFQFANIYDEVQWDYNFGIFRLHLSSCGKTGCWSLAERRNLSVNCRFVELVVKLQEANGYHWHTYGCQIKKAFPIKRCSSSLKNVWQKNIYVSIKNFCWVRIWVDLWSRSEVNFLLKNLVNVLNR